MRLPRLLRSTAAQVVAVVLAAGVALVAAPVATAVAPVGLDDFSGNVRGVRTVETDGTASFTENGGKGVVRTTHPGGGAPSSVTLRYAIPTADLTSGGSNGQFFLEFDSIVRSSPSPGEVAANIWITLVDSLGRESIAASSGISNAPDGYGIVRPLCDAAAAGCSGGFSGTADFTSVTEIAVTVAHPKNLDGANELVAVIDAIRTTPLAGAQPAPRAAYVTTESSTYRGGADGTSVHFRVRYSGTTPFSGGAWGANDFAVATTGGTTARVTSVTGTAEDHVVKVAVGGSSGTVRLDVPAGMLHDTWGQPTVGSSATVAYTRVPAPVLPELTAEQRHLVVGTPLDLQLDVPDPADYLVISGMLPPELTLSSSGRISGTPTVAGDFSATILAQDEFRQSDAKTYEFRVLPTVTFPASPDVNLTLGLPSAPFGIVALGASAGTVALTLDGLPAGMSFDPVTRTVSGTPTAAGTFPLTAVATSVAVPSLELGRARVQTLTVGVPPSAEPLGSIFVREAQPSTIPLPPGNAYQVVAGSLPVGMVISGASITGVPTGAGTSSFTLFVTNPFGSSTITGSIVVGSSVVVPGATRDAVVGEAFSHEVLATGLPAPDVTVSQGTLPPGVTARVEGALLTLSGTPTVPGTYDVAVRAVRTLSGDDVSATIRVIVREKPVVTPASDLTVHLGDAVDRTFVATGDPAPAWTATGLPAGVRATDLGDGSVRIHGTPTTSGTSAMTLTATNMAGSASTSFVLHVQKAPAFTSADDLDLEAGVPVSAVVTVDGYPVPTITATGLPQGLTFADRGDGTATISGTPARGGATTVRLTATNVVSAATTDVEVTVVEKPAVTSDPVAKVVAGGAVNLTVTFGGFPVPALALESAGAGAAGVARVMAASRGVLAAGPAPVAATTLPPGLTFTDNGDGTATIAGRPTVGGLFRPTVVATSSAGVTRQTLDLTVAAITTTDVSGDEEVVVGDKVDLTFRAGGYPTPVLRVVGTLPLGLTFTDNGDGTGTLRGTVLVTGTHTVTIEADNGAVRRFSATIVAAVQEAPGTDDGADDGGGTDEPTPGPADGTDEPADDTDEPTPTDDDSTDGDSTDGDSTDGVDRLPRTGTEGLTSLVVALAAIALGALMVEVRRRRA
ncbi:putative Ig domain-containing protein [Flavimobilis soli]|uniref:Putative Ig domain-containing protein n=1 Tax=Flavimobilis soli TaxID=442709 RepID=A0A2A9ECA2_9MICO|nr:putative Ig domain-containing protein [Flavimobilis soli]PFG36687.1 putative Ig domain-containing protein [Flavimobilis soli]